MNKNSISITLPIELTNGNDGRGNRWFSSSKVRKDIEAELRLLGLPRQPFEVPVRIHITRVLGRGQRFWDADSLLRGNSKELIDALVSIGWFVDDGPKYVTRVSASQDASQRDNGPAVTVTVEPEKTPMR
ncbi:MAG: hypothetical protein AAF939_03240 [Planctomycetota bacterium]